MHSCDQCGTTFTRKYNLTRHKDRHCKYGLPSYGVKTSQSTSNWPVTAATPDIDEFSPTLGQKRPSSSNFNAAHKETEPRNPKIKL